MRYLLYPLFLALIIVIIAKVSKNPPKKEPPWNNTSNGNTNYSNFETTQTYAYNTYTKPTTEQAKPSAEGYQAKFLLTKNEWYEHKKLRKYAEERGLIICPKVRLLDIVEPIRGNGYMSRLGRIQSKHVDFVICDQNMHIKGVLELDDNSHNQPDREKRDVFVNTLLQKVGYTVIRTRSVTETTLDIIARKPETNTTTASEG